MNQPRFPSSTSGSRSWSLLDRKQSAALAAISALAIVIAAYLVFMKLTGQITNLIGCGGADGCVNVLGGRWASWLLVPISVWSLLTYVALAITTLWGTDSQLRRLLVVSICFLLASAAIWFISLQLFVEGQLCFWCITLHTLGLSAFSIVVFALCKSTITQRQSLLKPALLGNAGAMSLLIAGQIWGPLPDTHQMSEAASVDLASVKRAAEAHPTTSDNPAAASESAVPRASGDVLESSSPTAIVKPERFRETSFKPRVVSFFDHQLQYELGDVPLLGDPQAEQVIIKYFDYTCSTCREMHAGLETIRNRNPSRLAIIVIPCPLNRSCNPHLRPEAKDHQHACEFARLGLTVWRADPTKFAEFHHKMFEHQGKVTPAKAKAFAISLVGQPAYEHAEFDLWIPDMMDKTIAVYRALSKTNPRMPKLVMGDKRVMHGIPRDLSQLEKLIFPDE